MNRNHHPLTLTIVLMIVTLSLGISARIAHAADGSGTLIGQVKFEGAPPKPVRINMSADPLCAKAHPNPAMTEDVVVGGNGGLGNVVVYVSDGLGSRTFQPPDKPVVFEQKGCQYTPHVLTMQAHQKLEVINSDETTHNIHPTPNNNREWNMTQPHGVPLEQSFAREEVAILVRCNVHPWMKGYIAVLKNPFFAVTDKNGNFEIKDLPPGTYTITAWQEKLGTKTQQVTIGPSESKGLNFEFKE